MQAMITDEDRIQAVLQTAHLALSSIQSAELKQTLQTCCQRLEQVVRRKRNSDAVENAIDAEVAIMTRKRKRLQSTAAHRSVDASSTTTTTSSNVRDSVEAEDKDESPEEDDDDDEQQDPFLPSHLGTRIVVLDDVDRSATSPAAVAKGRVYYDRCWVGPHRIHMGQDVRIDGFDPDVTKNQPCYGRVRAIYQKKRDGSSWMSVQWFYHFLQITLLSAHRKAQSDMPEDAYAFSSAINECRLQRIGGLMPVDVAKQVEHMYHDETRSLSEWDGSDTAFESNSPDATEKEEEDTDVADEAKESDIETAVEEEDSENSSESDDSSHESESDVVEDKKHMTRSSMPQDLVPLPIPPVPALSWTAFRACVRLCIEEKWVDLRQTTFWKALMSRCKKSFGKIENADRNRTFEEHFFNFTCRKTEVRATGQCYFCHLDKRLAYVIDVAPPLLPEAHGQFAGPECVARVHWLRRTGSLLHRTCNVVLLPDREREQAERIFYHELLLHVARAPKPFVSTQGIGWRRRERGGRPNTSTTRAAHPRMTQQQTRMNRLFRQLNRRLERLRSEHEDKQDAMTTHHDS